MANRMIFCEPCRKEGHLDKHADGFCDNCTEYLCNTCLKLHAKFLPSHTTQDATQMPYNVSDESCPEHSTDIIKFYCDTCGTLACSLCKENDHKKCISVQYIPSIADGVEDSEEFKEFCKKLENVDRSADKAKSDINTHLAEHKLLANEAKKTVLSQREVIDSYLCQEESKLVKQIKDILSGESKKSKDALEVCSEVEEDLKPLLALAQECKSGLQKTTLFIQMKKSQKILAGLQNKLTTICAEPLLTQEHYNSVTEGAFAKLVAYIQDNSAETHNDRIAITTNEESQTTAVASVNSHGKRHMETKTALSSENEIQHTLHLNDRTKCSAIPKQVKSLNSEKADMCLLEEATYCHDEIGETGLFQLQKDVIIQKDNDEVTGMISGMCLVTENLLVAVDQDRALVLAVDTTPYSSRPVIGSYYFNLLFSASPSCPYGVAAVGDMQVAVSVPTTGNIAFMTLKSRKILKKLLSPNLSFSKDRSMFVGKGCSGLATVGENLVVSFADIYGNTNIESRVEVMNMTGKTLKSFSNKTFNTKLFQQPTGVAVSPDQRAIYVSDSLEKAIVRISTDGSVKKVSSDNLYEPMGLSVDEEGYVYVCAGRGIHRIVPDLVRGRDVADLRDVKGILTPLSLALCSVTKRLFIGYETNIKIFQDIR